MMKKSDNTSLDTLTSTGLLAKNISYNLLGQVLPMIVALVSLPIIVRHLGAERFGVLALAWVFVGYMGFFDLGLGRVITKMIGEKLGQNDESSVPTIFWTGIFYMTLLGLAVSILLYIFSPQLVNSVLKISTAFQTEALLGFRYLALATTFVIITVGMRAVLEAYQKFGVLNIVRTINGVLLYLVPLVLVPFTQSIDVYVLALVAIRIFILILYAMTCFWHIPLLRQKVSLNKSLTGEMFKLGGWISVSNIIGPIMIYLDRFFIGVWLSVTAVAYYVTPYEVISKLLLLASSVVRVLFPAFSTMIQSDVKKAENLYSRGIRILIFSFFPIVLGVVLFAAPALQLWLGREFAAKSTAVTQWLAIGIYMNAPGQIAYAALQASGRPDITAKLHVVETPLFLLMLFVFLMWFGITGAAIAWSMRLLIDTCVLVYFAEKLVFPRKSFGIGERGLFAFSIFILLVLIFLRPTLWLSILIFAVIGVLAIWAFWMFLFRIEERHFIIQAKRNFFNIVFGKLKV